MSNGSENRLDSDQNRDGVPIWVQTDCKSYQQTTKVAAGKLGMYIREHVIVTVITIIISKFREFVCINVDFDRCINS